MADFNEIYKNNKVLGFLGFDHYKGDFIKIYLSYLLEDLKFFRAFFVWLVFKIITPKVKKDEIRIDWIAVDELFRGKGIGTKLLNIFLKYAKENGFKVARLEVLNTNNKAIKLYEKIGFIIKRIKKYYFISKVLGYSEEIYMYLQL